MVGTTRSRVSFFMNRFRNSALSTTTSVENLLVHSSLLNVVLHDDDATGISTKSVVNPASQGPEPPNTPGEPLDKERAKGPVLVA